MVPSLSPSAAFIDAWSATEYVSVSPALEGSVVRSVDTLTNASTSFKLAQQPTAVFAEDGSVFVGFKDGSVSVYSHSSLLRSFTQHKTAVVQIAQTDSGLMSVSQDGLIIHSSSDGSLLRSFATGKSTSCAAFDGERVFIGDYQIHEYSLETSTVTRTLNGHTSRINSLSLCDASIVSSAQDDRSVNVSGLTASRILMSETSIVQSGIVDSTVFGLTESGIVLLWDLSVVQKKKKYAPMLPSGSITVKLDDSLIPVKSARFLSATTIELVYGAAAFNVERVVLAHTHQTLTRATPQKTATASASHNPAKTITAAPLDQQKSFKEIIDESTEQEVPILQRPTASSLTSLLQQALHTSDLVLLQQAFAITQPLLIQATLARLPVSLLPTLLKTLCGLLGKPSRITSLLVWFRSLLATHTSILTTHPELLRGVQLILIERVKNAERIHALNGKLNLVLGHTRETQAYEQIEHGIVYEESDEEDSESEDEEKEYNDEFAFDSDASMQEKSGDDSQQGEDGDDGSDSEEGDAMDED